MGRRVPGSRIGNPASPSIWNRGPESTKIATPLEGHKLTKVSATICRVDGTARWLIIAESISCAWLWLARKFASRPTGGGWALLPEGLVRNRLLDGILSGDVRDVHGDIIDTIGRFFSFRR